MESRDRRVIRVLIVEDSPVVRELLAHILGSDPEIEVVGTAKNGAEAVEMCLAAHARCHHHGYSHARLGRIRSDPQDNEGSSRSRGRRVRPASKKRRSEGSFRAVEAGALTILKRPVGIGHPDHEKLARELIRTVKLMSEVKVVRRWRRAGEGEVRRVSSPPTPILSSGTPEIEVVVIGASTGGPAVIQSLLSGISGDFPVPILLVQHMADGFIPGIRRLAEQDVESPGSISRKRMSRSSPGTSTWLPRAPR